MTRSISQFEIATDRLAFAAIQSSDLDRVHELLLIPETDRFNALGIPRDVAQTYEWVSSWISEASSDCRPSFTLVLTTLETSAFVGLFGIKLTPTKYRSCEIWYKLHPNHWGLGLGTEATKAVIDVAFSKLSILRVEAGVAVDNIASIRVLEKSGMAREGTKRKNLPLKSGFSDSYFYSILNPSG